MNFSDRVAVSSIAQNVTVLSTNRLLGHQKKVDAGVKREESTKKLTLSFFS